MSPYDDNDAVRILRESADVVLPGRYELDEVMTRAEHTQRRRRLGTQLVAAALTLGLVGGGAWLANGALDDDRGDHVAGPAGSGSGSGTPEASGPGADDMAPYPEGQEFILAADHVFQGPDDPRPWICGGGVSMSQSGVAQAEPGSQGSVPASDPVVECLGEPAFELDGFTWPEDALPYRRSGRVTSPGYQSLRGVWDDEKAVFTVRGTVSENALGDAVPGYPFMRMGTALSCDNPQGRSYEPWNDLTQVAAGPAPNAQILTAYKPGFGYVLMGVGEAEKDVAAIDVQGAASCKTVAPRLSTDQQRRLVAAVKAVDLPGLVVWEPYDSSASDQPVFAIQMMAPALDRDKLERVYAAVEQAGFERWRISAMDYLWPIPAGGLPEAPDTPVDTSDPVPADTSRFATLREGEQATISMGLITSKVGAADEPRAPYWCDGAVMESYPPQCGGELIPLKGVTWERLAKVASEQGVTFTEVPHEAVVRKTGDSLTVESITPVEPDSHGGTAGPPTIDMTATATATPTATLVAVLPQPTSQASG